MNIVSFVGWYHDHYLERLGPGRFYPLLLTVLCLLGLVPLLMPGLPQAHDLYHHLSRLHAMRENLSHGMFPVMINASALQGYGYAAGLLYPDFFLYPVAFLSLCGLSLINAYKIFVLVLVLANAYSAYAVMWKIGRDHFVAFAAGLLYTWSSYFAVLIFQRAALGEMCAFPFLPWILLGLYEIVYRDWRKFHYLALGFAGLVLSHNLSLLLLILLTAVLLAFWHLRLLREVQRVIALVAALLLCCLLSGFYLARLLEQVLSNNFTLSTYAAGKVVMRAVAFPRLFLELPYLEAGQWFPPGIGVILLVVCSQRLRFRGGDSNAQHFRDVLLLMGLLCLLSASTFLPWEGAMRALAVIQFPWRFYLPATAGLALGAALTLGTIVNDRPAERRRWLWVLMVGCAAAWWLNVSYHYAAKIHEKAIFRHFEPGTKPEARRLAYLPQGVSAEDLTARGERVLAEPELPLKHSRPRPGMIELSYEDNRSDCLVELPLLWYKGYAAVLKDQHGSRHLQVSRSEQHCVTVLLPGDSNAGVLRVWYRGTLLQWLSRGLSLLCLLLMLGLRCRRNWRRRVAKRLAEADAQAAIGAEISLAELQSG
jgi:hypothetical protein